MAADTLQMSDLLLVLAGAALAYFFARREKKQDRATDQSQLVIELSQRITHLERDKDAHEERAKEISNLRVAMESVRGEVMEARAFLDAKIESMCQDFKRLNDTMLRLVPQALAPSPPPQPTNIAELMTLLERAIARA